MTRNKLLAPVRPNLGLEAEFRRRLVALVEEMHRSFCYWVTAQWNANPPEMAADESPAAGLRKAMKELADRWQSRFDDAALDLADHFAKDVVDRSDRTLRAILKKAGFSVRFKMTRTMNDVLSATIGEQVGLIRSIPAAYLTQVEGMVLRSVTTGRDLKQLSDDLREQLGVAKRRAALIARDQNNKATATLTRVRQTELGVIEAVWVHSGGGKHPRPSHLKAGRNKVRYDVKKGWYDPDEGEYIFPGELINCRCVSRSVIPGF